MFDCQHGRVFLHLVQFTLRSGAVQNDQKLLIFFSFIGSLSPSDKLHHHRGTRRMYLLSFTGTSCGDDSFPAWSDWLQWAQGDLWPRLQGYNGLSRSSCGSRLQGEFKVAESCASSSVCSCYDMLLQESEDPSLIRLWLSFFSTFSPFRGRCPLQEKPVEASWEHWMLPRWIFSVCLNHQSGQTGASSYAGGGVNTVVELRRTSASSDGPNA